jgi:hypothetical protein
MRPVVPDTPVNEIKQPQDLFRLFLANLAGLG